MAKKILVIDDEEQLVDMLKMRLRANGYEVIAAYDGEEGLRKAGEFKPDLIVLDIIMPKMAGSDVAAALKENKELSDIPIIFLTCLAEGAVGKQGGAKIGGNLFIAKPFEAEDLLSMIDSVFRK